MRLLPRFAAIAAAAIMAVGPASAQSGTDEVAIRAVVEQFRLAIIAKDRAALARLPLSDAITFASAVDAQTLAKVRARRPSAQRVVASSYPAFVDEITSSKDAQEEKFSAIAIRTDGTVASVHFDYRFEENHIETNRGQESWGLIKTDTGWKISSVIWSVSLPPARGK